MARAVKQEAAPSGLNAEEKAELRRLLADVEYFDPSPEAPYDVCSGAPPPPGLQAALLYAFAHGIRTGAHLKAMRCFDGWVIDSRIMSDLRRLVA